MNTARLGASLRSLVSLLVLAAAATVQAAPPAKWSIESLGSLSGRGSFANGLNNRGDVVGYSGTGIPSGFGPAYFHGFLWQNGTMQDAGTPSGQVARYSSLIAINDHGVAVGAADQFVYQWQDGTWTALGFTGEPADINKSGDIVGSRWGNGYHGWLYRDGVLHEMPRHGTFSTQANAINDRGVVVGTTGLAVGSSSAFRWENGVMEVLGTLGGAWSMGNDINNHGEIVGRSATGSGSEVAFIYDRAGMRPLIDMTTNAFPVAINDRGAVVGTLDFNTASFLFQDGVLRRLEDIPAVRAAGWVRLYPEDINDHGWITGSGMRAGSTTREGFLLKPR